MLSGLFGHRKKHGRMTVAEAFDYLIQEEENKLIDMDQVTRLAVEAPSRWHHFIDEIDKIAGRESAMARRFRAKACSVTSCRSRGHHGQHPLRISAPHHVLLHPAAAFHITKPSAPDPRTSRRLPIPR